MDISSQMKVKLAFDSKIYHQLSVHLSILDTFKGSWMMKEDREGRYLKELQKIATIESTGASTRIDGAKLRDEELGKLLAPNQVTRFESYDEQAIAGYYDALKLILDNFTDIEISEQFIHQLHRILLKHSEKDQLHRGNYKISSNKVDERYPDGIRRVLFDPTPPNLVPLEMPQLIDWLNERFSNKDIHPLIYIAGFVYEFLSIHPYRDGNGRLSRLLTTLLMMKQGYGYIQFASFESVIESSEEEYYRVLMEGQKNRYNDKECVSAWVLYFMRCLIKLTEGLDARFETYSKLKTALNKRQQMVLGFVRGNEPAQLSDIETALGVYSRNTLKKDLVYLVKEKLLLKAGNRKGTRYHLLKREDA